MERGYIVNKIFKLATPYYNMLYKDSNINKFKYLGINLDKAYSKGFRSLLTRLSIRMLPRSLDWRYSLQRLNPKSQSSRFMDLPICFSFALPVVHQFKICQARMLERKLSSKEILLISCKRCSQLSMESNKSILQFKTSQAKRRKITEVD